MSTIKIDVGSVESNINDCDPFFQEMNNSLSMMKTNLGHIKRLWSGCDANSSNASVEFELSKLLEIETGLADYVTKCGYSVDKYKATDDTTF